MMVLRFTIQGNSNCNTMIIASDSAFADLIHAFFIILSVFQDYRIIIMTDSQVVMIKTERDVERTRNSSATEASSTASDSPTPTNSVQDKNWVHWHGPSNEIINLFIPLVLFFYSLTQFI